MKGYFQDIFPAYSDVWDAPEESRRITKDLFLLLIKRELLEIMRFVWCVTVVRFAQEGLSDQNTRSAFLKWSLHGCGVNVSILENVRVCVLWEVPGDLSVPSLPICFFSLRGSTHLKSQEWVLCCTQIEMSTLLHSDDIGESKKAQPSRRCHLTDVVVWCFPEGSALRGRLQFVFSVTKGSLQPHDKWLYQVLQTF